MAGVHSRFFFRRVIHLDSNDMHLGLKRIVRNIFEETPKLKYDDLVPNNTALVVIDMVNGFTNEGLLQSPRVAALSTEVKNIVTSCQNMGMTVIAFADYHAANSPEFAVYGPHCQAGTRESELIDELQDIGGYTLIKKNSSNGFLEPVFQQWLNSNPQVTDFVVIGNCTDICIMQFCLTLKAYFNMLNKESRIVVPINAVDTFDFDLHHGDLTHTMALFNMSINGIEIVSGLTYDN